MGQSAGNGSCGSIVVNGGNGVIRNSTFSNNKAINGGAIFVISSQNLNIVDSNFFNNTANNGGAIYVMSCDSLCINNSNFVNNEVNRAFAEKKSILVFQIDDSKLEGGLEFFLKNKQWIKAYPNPEDKFEELSSKTEKLVKENSGIVHFVKEHKTPVIIGVIVLILIIAAAGFMMNNGVGNGTTTSQLKAGEVKLKITDFHVDDVRKEDTDWNYSYFVGGTISPSEADGCIIVVDFYDKTGKLVDTTETPFEDAQKVSSGFLFGSTVSDTNDIKFVDVQLVNNENIILAEDDSQIK